MTIVAVAGTVVKAKASRRAVTVLLAAAPVVLGAWLTGALLLSMLLLGSPPPVVPAAPGAAASGCVVAAPATQTRTPLTPEQFGNAAVIIAVARSLHVPPAGWVVAIATALQESNLRNLNYGDGTSVGLFQQIDSWGSVAQRTTPAWAAGRFFAALGQIQGWQQMAVTVAAQAVQRSAFPDAYAQWETLARAVAGDKGVASASCTTPATSSSPAVAAARTQLGVPYSWGGGGPTGPTLGIGPGAGTVGFDCSGLTQYAWAQAGIRLPRTTNEQAAATPHLAPGAPLQAGDLLFFGAPGSLDHAGISDGQGGMIHAPHTGSVVTLVPNVLADPYYAAHFALATRP